MTTSSESGNDAFEQLLNRLYQAPTEPETWPSVLEEIAHSVDSTFAAFIARRNDRWVGWSLSPGTPPGADAYLRSAAATRSLTTPRLLAANHAGFVRNVDVMTDAEYYADPFMSEWGTRAGIDHAAASAILLTTGDALVCQVQRMRGQPPFAPHDLARLDALRPHLARAGLLASRWRLARMTAATDALALLEYPAVVLDSRGVVLAANALVDGLTRYIVWRDKNRVALTDPWANTLLQRAISHMSRPAQAAVRSIAARSKGNGPRAVVHLIPATGKSRDFFGGGFGILVITPVTSSSPLDTGLVQGLFDLSPAEARIASGMAEGLSIHDIASKSDVGYETVRTQIRSIFAKTGTKRQGEVVALLLGISRLK